MNYTDAVNQLLTPKQIAVLALGGLAWHVCLKAWPSVKAAAKACCRAYPWLRDNGGVWGAGKAVLFGGEKKQPPNTVCAGPANGKAEEKD